MADAIRAGRSEIVVADAQPDATRPVSAALAGWIVCTPVVLGERRRWDTDPDSPPVSAENRGRGGQGEHDEIKPGSAARVMSISGSPTFDPAVLCS